LTDGSGRGGAREITTTRRGAWGWICPTGIFAYSTLETMLIPALPQIRAHYQVALSEAGWVFSALALSGAITTPLIGRAADIYGAKRMFVSVLIALGGGIVMSATAASFWQLVLGQALQGSALSLVPLSVAIGCQENDLTASKSIVIAATLSTIAGFFLASLLLQLADYRILYWVSLAPVLICVAAGALGGTLKAAKRPITGDGDVDWIGGGLLAAIFLSILTGIGASASTALWHTIVAALVLVIWFKQSAATRNPVVDRRLLRHPAVGRVAVITAATGMGAFGSFVLIPVIVEMPRIEGGLGGNPSLSGICLAGFGALGAISPFFVPWMRRHVSSRWVMQLGTSLIMAGLMGILVPASIASLFLASSAIGAGIGLLLTQGIDLLGANVPMGRLASASALIFVTKSIGHAIGAQAAASLLSSGKAPAAVLFPVLLACCFCAVALAAGLRIPTSEQEKLNS